MSIETNTSDLEELIALAEALPDAVTLDNRTTFRGRNLGTEITEAQIAAVRDGSFTDLWLGDYWEIGGFTWRIVDFDYFYNLGDTAVTIHHLVIMPDEVLAQAQMNTTNTTEGGFNYADMNDGYTWSENYIGEMYNIHMGYFNGDYGGPFANFSIGVWDYVSTEVTNGYPSAGTWMGSPFNIPSEMQMYGTQTYTPASDGATIPARYALAKGQFALFKVRPEFIIAGSRASNPFVRQRQWLRDVASATRFCFIEENGLMSATNASNSRGVRIYFAMG